MENLEIYLDYIGDDSYVYRYNYDNKRYYNTGISLKGNPGNPGRPGRPGKDGKTPHIGTNGDWYIGDVDTGVKAYTRTEVVTQLPEPSETTKNQIYVAPALNPQEGDSYSEYVTVYKDGQYKWELLGTKIATMGASGNNHKGGLVPDTPSIAGTTKFLCEDGTWKVIDINSKEDVTTIVAPVNETDATAPITTLTAETGKYYHIDVPVETLAVTLPAMTDTATVRTVALYLTAGTTPAITIAAADNKSMAFQDGYEIEAGKTYEINCLYNGAAWVVSALTIIKPAPMNVITYKTSAKLAEVTTTSAYGLHTNAFSGTNGQLTITSHTFKNGVGTIEFDGDVTSIGTQAFYSCDTLTSITIPDSVTSIGTQAFYECTHLTSIGGVGSGASIEIPDSVTSIGTQAFQWCSGLTSITIPNSVTSIGDSAFNNCSGLTSITIPNSVTTIGDWNFYKCNSLTSIVSNAMIAPTIQNNTFKGIKTDGTLTVPSGSSGYDKWMGTGNYYLGKYGWTKVEIDI